MFPTPIEKTTRATQVTYQAMLPLALALWLAPLIAVAPTTPIRQKPCLCMMRISCSMSAWP